MKQNSNISLPVMAAVLLPGNLKSCCRHAVPDARLLCVIRRAGAFLPPIGKGVDYLSALGLLLPKFPLGMQLMGDSA